MVVLGAVVVVQGSSWQVDQLRLAFSAHFILESRAGEILSPCRALLRGHAYHSPLVPIHALQRGPGRFHVQGADTRLGHVLHQQDQHGGLHHRRHVPPCARACSMRTSRGGRECVDGARMLFLAHEPSSSSRVNYPMANASQGKQSRTLSSPTRHLWGPMSPDSDVSRTKKPEKIQSLSRSWPPSDTNATSTPQR